MARPTQLPSWLAPCFDVVSRARFSPGPYTSLRGPLEEVIKGNLDCLMFCQLMTGLRDGKKELEAIPGKKTSGLMYVGLWCGLSSWLPVYSKGQYIISLAEGATPEAEGTWAGLYWEGVVVGTMDHHIQRSISAFNEELLTGSHRFPSIADLWCVFDSSTSTRVAGTIYLSSGEKLGWRDQLALSGHPLPLWCNTSRPMLRWA